MSQRFGPRNRLAPTAERDENELAAERAYEEWRQREPIAKHNPTWAYAPSWLKANFLDPENRRTSEEFQAEMAAKDKPRSPTAERDDLEGVAALMMSALRYARDRLAARGDAAMVIGDAMRDYEEWNRTHRPTPPAPDRGERTWTCRCLDPMHPLYAVNVRQAHTPRPEERRYRAALEEIADLDEHYGESTSAGEIAKSALSDHGSLGHGVATEEADDNDHLWHDPEAANRAKRSDHGSEDR